MYDFQDFALRVTRLSPENSSISLKACIYRVGVTNAADRGLDMWANFGLAIQVKHLSLTEELAESVVHSVSSDRIVIVCKDSEATIIVSLLNQIGWKARIQSIITESDLYAWYEKALRGKYSHILGSHVLAKMQSELEVEFPVTSGDDFTAFLEERGYNVLHDALWKV